MNKLVLHLSRNRFIQRLRDRVVRPIGGRSLRTTLGLILEVSFPGRLARRGIVPFVARRGEELIVLLAAEDAPQTRFLCQSERIVPGPCRRLVLRKLALDGTIRETTDATWLLALTNWFKLDLTVKILSLILRPAHDAHEKKRQSLDYPTRLSLLKQNLELIDFLYDRSCYPAAPFNVPTGLPSILPAEPKTRSVLFVHNNYYHFNHLSNALQERGWSATTVSLEPVDSPQRQFFHGEDINLHRPDSNEMNRVVHDFFSRAPERFGAIHFYGQGQPSLFPSNFENTDKPKHIPWDFLELRRHNIIIGYMPSGCLDGALQSSIREVTGGVCRRCIWELRPDVCSDRRSAAWAEKLDAVCDWVGLECDWSTKERVGPKFVRRPVVTALDPDYWHPGLIVPEDMIVARQSNEILVYHGVGNYASRRAQGRDIKGTGAVLAAIDRLQAEGFPIKLLFATDVPSTRVRFLQVQADIVVDQLNYGRYGANARESMMLGKPVIGSLNAADVAPLAPHAVILEAPIVNATEETIYDRLKELVRETDRRLSLGRRSREFALKWHAAEVCALRYERIIDRIRAGKRPDSDEVFA